MPSIEVVAHDSSSLAKPSPEKPANRHQSKKRKRDVEIEGTTSPDIDPNLKKKERKDEKVKKEKRKKSNKAKDGREDGKQTPTHDENKNLKQRLQSMVIDDSRESLVTEPLSSDRGEGNPAINPTTLHSPLKPILKSPANRMENSKSPLDTVDSNATQTNGNSTPAKGALSKPSRTKKSVKFHSEAAAEDGESRQRIHNALIAAYKASDAAEAAAVTPEELASSLDTNAPPAKKLKREKRKKEKKEKVKKGGKDENAKEGAINYMLQYHKSRETWKFQKAKQNWILRNTFDIKELEGTKENEAALKAYITGLQGQDARNRLLEEAKKILEEGHKGAEADAEGAVKIGDEIEGRLARAKLVMIGLGHEDDEDGEDGEDSENIVVKDGKGGEVSTLASEDEDMDDESESEDSEEEDSDELDEK